MIFDHDPEVGAFLLLNLLRTDKDGKPKPVIEGYLYRKEEKTDSEGNVIEKKFSMMDVDGEWKQVWEYTNPFLHHAQHFLDTKFSDDKSKIEWPFYADYLADTAPRNSLNPDPNFQLNLEYYFKSEAWIRQHMFGDIVVELDKFEYNVGDSK
jgi:hypothetical protein